MQDSAIDPERGGAEAIDEVVHWLHARWDPQRVGAMERFVRAYYAAVAPEDLAARSTPDLYGAALGHWHTGATRPDGENRVHVYNPDPERHGWESTHTIVDVVVEDSPFLVDSISMALNRAGATVHLIVHPVLRVHRDAAGRWLDVLPGEASAETAGDEAWMHFEIDRRSGAQRLEALRDSVLDVLEDVRRAVADWQPMRRRLNAALSSLRRQPPAQCPAGELEEVSAFLRWVRDDHFTFLGYREYDLVGRDDDRVLEPKVDSGLGVLRDPPAGRPTRFSELPAQARDHALDSWPLVMTKSSAPATVHRPGYMDYLGVKRFNAAGEVIGEHRFLGLYTSAAYNRTPDVIPVLRRKIEWVREHAGFQRSSHAGKALANILETYPRDELLQITPRDLLRIALGILHLQERQRVRVFLRDDTWQRYVSCLVFVPRDRYDTSVRRRMQAILEEVSGGDSSEFSVQLSTSVLARIHFIVRMPAPGLPDIDVSALEQRLAATVRIWQDDLREALHDACGEERGGELFEHYGHAFSAAYREEIDARTAAHDIQRIETMEPDGAPGMALYRPLEALDGTIRFKVFHGPRPATLSDALPVLEHMGVRVVDERPFEVTPAHRADCWIHDFGLMWEGGGVLDVDAIAEVFQEAFAAVWQHRAEDDGFNRLVLAAGLRWDEVALLRAYARYLRQAGTAFSQTYLEETLVSNPEVARALIDLFTARFDPARCDPGRAELIVETVENALAEVGSLDEDRILRRFLAAFQATVRTNRYRIGVDEPLALKLHPSSIPDLPRPCPWAEIFVYAPDVEGVHLRGGEVARGGIRWSDRREDYRTEILGLVKAQMVKNAVIVPVGAKGGFIVKRADPAPPDDPLAPGREAYARYIRAMLQMTDNLQEARTVAPERVVRHDSDDAYLVVAADKGTATFSDRANEVSESMGFWLRDAFASGGSSGYDHKRMGITARGAWVGVQRHFRELGVDVQRDPIRVVGIGDLSGDVFGNGMLLSGAIALVGAFDHRHIFLDPDPDPARQFEERRRLFQMGRSSWADFDHDLLSAGGGIYPRSAKAIELTDEVRALLGIDAARLAPHELIRALLCAPVDLLWNGGIGTYVKASDQTHAEVDDRGSDAVRVNAADVQARVIGEGGNLGLTQRGRVEYAARSGRINTDFIDNAGGVDCSDHEVNIKILLNELMDDGDLTRKHRDELLEEMTEEVASLVLHNCDRQTTALSLAELRAGEALDEHASLMRRLEREGLLDRGLEDLPDDETLGERAQRGEGLWRPELAVLQAYVKIVVQQALLRTDLPDDRVMDRVLASYFPAPLQQRYPERLQQHRLRRELVATVLTNALVNRMGPTFLHRLSERTGHGFDAIAQAWQCADAVFGIEREWEAADALVESVPADVHLRMLMRLRRLHEHMTVRILQGVGNVAEAAAAPATDLERLAGRIRCLDAELPGLLPRRDAEAAEREEEDLRSGGVPQPLARRQAHLDALRPALDLIALADACQVDLLDAARAYFRLFEALDLSELRDRIRHLAVPDKWHARLRVGLEADFYQYARETAARFLAECPAEAEPRETFIASRAAAASRLESVLADLQGQSEITGAMLAVALQELRALSQSVPGPAERTSGEA